MRKTTQDVLPRQHTPTSPGQYDIYPGFPLGNHKIFTGFEELAQKLAGRRSVLIDGYGGVLWQDFRDRLDAALKYRGIKAQWLAVDQAMHSPSDINKMVAPFLGGDDPIFGTRFTGHLRNFFDAHKLQRLQPDSQAEMTIGYGCGAGLLDWDATLIYVDIPKNEIQFRSRAGSITNLGIPAPEPPKKMYKRFYFVDWVALNRHKADLLPRIDLIVDGQRPDDITFMTGSDLRQALAAMSQNYFRVRPWFEPGAWGGQWIKQHIPQLPQAVPNYAWSFELIVPENGLLLESDKQLLEISFDFLMYQEQQRILGTAAGQFGYEFPIRFDFLDTFAGGNLSLQCHPRPEFIKENFGESFTQDETYYILDCKPDAQVYLGFQEDIEPEAFRQVLEDSVTLAQPVDIERYVQLHPAKKHDLFLIPNGAVHCSGINNLVLEISATPYIFTFKMYDWLRLDLDGKPRPLNLERAFANLRFDYKGERVKQELIARPVTIEQNDDWSLIHLPTHSDHFYDVHRLEIEPGKTAALQTGASCHILSLVEGQTLLLQTEHGLEKQFNYAETFVIPAAAESYRLTNNTAQPIKVIKAFIKPVRRFSKSPPGGS
jgi:mannose-6-phosphate isomerase class I